MPGEDKELGLLHCLCQELGAHRAPLLPACSPGQKSGPVFGEQDPLLVPAFLVLPRAGFVAGRWLQDEEELSTEPKASGQCGAGDAVWEQGGECSCKVSACFFPREVSQGLNATETPVGRDRGNKAGNDVLLVMQKAEPGGKLLRGKNTKPTSKQSVTEGK